MGIHCNGDANLWLCGLRRFCRLQYLCCAVDGSLPFGIYQRFEFLLIRWIESCSSFMKTFHQLLQPCLLAAGEKSIGTKTLDDNDGTVAVRLTRCHNPFQSI